MPFFFSQFVKFLSRKWVIFLAAGLSAILYLFFLLATLPTVPFHPDETTYIYMSEDFDRILTLGPLSVCWRAETAADRLQVQRERDCPLNRYTIGLGRRIAGLPMPLSDWDWDADWETNVIIGAVPSQELLLAARIPQVLFLFLAVLLMARIGWRLGGRIGGISASILLAVNSQFLLHGRRAMAEAGLLFGMVLVIAVLLEQQRPAGKKIMGFFFPLFTGVALALAASAKYSGLLMAPVALTAMFLGYQGKTLQGFAKQGLARSGILGIGFLAGFLFLNPVYWCDPISTLSAVIAARKSLLSVQLESLRIGAPGLVLDSFSVRLLAIPYQQFFAPLAFWDIPTYQQATAASEYAYSSIFINGLTGGTVFSSLWCGLSLVGLGLAVRRSVRRAADSRIQILAVWFLTVFVGNTIVVPILWQRYYLPFIPIGAALSALAIAALWNYALQIKIRPHR